MSSFEAKKAREIYQGAIEMFDSINWTYDRDDDNLVIDTGVKSDDLPIDIRLRVHERNQVVIITSNLPFSVAEDKRVDLAVAISAVNYMLIDGSFDYNFLEGRISFRMTATYRDAQVGKEFFEYLVMCACNTIDDYNDKFFMISKGLKPVAEFVTEELKG